MWVRFGPAGKKSTEEARGRRDNGRYKILRTQEGMSSMTGAQKPSSNESTDGQSLLQDRRGKESMGHLPGLYFHECTPNLHQLCKKLHHTTNFGGS